MSTVLSGRDVLLAGDPHYASTAACSTVDVSSVTPWGTSHLDNAPYHCEHSHHVFLPDMQNSTRFNELSPHLQHNKQLQNTLIQKEEELSRLQDENNKLKEFFNSAIVKSIKKKSKEFLFAQKSSELRKRKITVNEEHSRQGSEGLHTCRKPSLELCLPKEVAATPPLNSWVLQTLGLQKEETLIADSPRADQTSYFCHQVTNINQKAFASSDIQNSSTGNAYSNTQCEYSSAKNFLPLYTVTTESLVNYLKPIDSTGHFTPPRAASCTLWQNCNRNYISSPSRNEEALFYVPHTTGGRIDLAFSMSLSPQNTVKTQSYPQGQAFTRRDSQGRWKFTWVPKHCS